MARRYENDCCDCAVPGYPCRGASCPRRNVLYVYCDECDGDITGEAYIYNGKEYCEEHLLEALISDGIIAKED